MSKSITFENLITEYKSSEINSLTSDSLNNLKEQIIETIKTRNVLKSFLHSLEKELLKDNKRLKWRMFFPFGKKIFNKQIAYLKEQIETNENKISDKKKELSNVFISTAIPNNENIISKFITLKEMFNKLSLSEFVWDITTSQFIDRVKLRSAASNAINRRRVNILFSSVDIIKSDEEAFHFQNANGGDIYIYPSMIIIVSPDKEFALLDYRDISLNYSESHFVEEENFPTDSQQVGTTWAKVNKDGSKDRRFSNNYQIPIALYGQLHWESQKGFNEVYQFSNSISAEQFYSAFMEYKRCIMPTRREIKFEH
ncbi:MAG: hypothetical protein PVF17_09480 [Ignavibacteria bacterium]|jgi:hypothetical protein